MKKKLVAVRWERMGLLRKRRACLEKTEANSCGKSQKLLIIKLGKTFDERRGGLRRKENSEIEKVELNEAFIAFRL